MLLGICYLPYVFGQPRFTISIAKMSSVNQLPDKFKREWLSFLIKPYDNYLSHFDEQQPVYFVLNPRKTH